MRLMIYQWKVIGDEGEGLANQVGAPLIQNKHASKKLFFSCKVFSFIWI